MSLDSSFHASQKAGTEALQVAMIPKGEGGRPQISFEKGLDFILCHLGRTGPCPSRLGSPVSEGHGTVH